MACPVQVLCRAVRTVSLWLLKNNNEDCFYFPLFMTLVHLTIVFCLSSLTRLAMQCWTGKPRVVVNWTDYLSTMATALDFGLSNWSFLFISIKEPNPYLIVVVLLIASGLFMFTFKSAQFNIKGFIMVLLALFIGGIRWTLTQVLIQKAELGLQNPIDTMYHLQPLMFIGLLPLFLFNEGLSLSTSEKLFRVNELSPILYSLATLSIGGSLAFGLSFSEFLLEVCTLLLAEGLMGDRMSGLNWMGFAVCVSGISLHVGLKTYYSKIHSLRLLPIKNSPNLELPLLRQQEDEGEETATEDDDEEQEILL
uniref:Solute carrier family 35 member C2 n=1 Tax=Hucho hucho TaxID=62062 RepID=A0A4W5NWJ0_9TELE